MPILLHAHDDTLCIETSQPFPSPQGGLTIRHFTRQCLFVFSLKTVCNDIIYLPIFALWTWAMSSKYDRVDLWANHVWGLSGQSQTWLLWLSSEPLPLLPAGPVIHTHTHIQSMNHPHLSLPVSVKADTRGSMMLDTDLDLWILAPVNNSTCQWLGGASLTVHRGRQFIHAISLGVYDSV